MKYFLLFTIFIVISCSNEGKVPGKKGEKCNEGSPCSTGLHCISDKCTTELDACKNITCSNHGKCEVNNSKATCKCDAGYEVSPNGWMCNIGNPCSGVDCSGHGTCSEQGGKAKCTCEDGYIPVFSIYCSSKDNPCEGINCKNGSCVIAGATPTCSCDDGYEFDGVECVKETNLCTGVTCSNHGKCIESSGQAICQCDEGFSQGTNLTCIKNPCDPNPCATMEGTNFEKTCSIANGNFVCTCDISSSYEWNDAQRKCVKDTSAVKCEDTHAHKDSSGNCVCNESYKADPNSTPKKPNKVDLICVPESDDPCATNPCAGDENKKCVVDNNEAKCVCKEGYKESNQNGQQKCIPDACNDDTCTEDFKTVCDYDESNNIKCFCVEGYEESSSGECKLKSACTETSCTKPNMTGTCLGNPLSASKIYCQCKPGFVGKNCDVAGDNWCCPQLNDGECDNPCQFIEHSTKECYALGGANSFCNCEAGYTFEDGASGAQCSPE